VSFAAWIDDPVHDESNALGRLVQRWRPEEPFRRVSCSQLGRSYLRCLRQRADWGSLRRQNLPVAMYFRAGSSAERAATLVGASDRDVTFIDGEAKIFHFPLQDVLPHWSGDYLVLWEPPLRYAFVSEGMHNDAVVWLRQRLTAAGYGSDPVGPAAGFDAPLAASVSRFQQASGIRADGVAGPETLARLIGMKSADGIPTLSQNFPQ
jgi:general secretion pathway protein A